MLSALVASHDAPDPIAGHRVRAFVFDLRRQAGRTFEVDAFLIAWSDLERRLVESPADETDTLRDRALVTFDDLRREIEHGGRSCPTSNGSSPRP